MLWVSNVLYKDKIFIKIVGAIFEKIEMFNLFLCELPLILAGWRYCKGTLDIELQRDLSVGLGATLSDGHTEFFLSFGDFSGKIR